MNWMLCGVLLWVSGSVFATELPVQTKTITEKSASVTIDVGYPQTQQPTIDAALAAWVKQQVDSFKDGSGDPDEARWSLDIEYNIARNDRQMFSVLFTVGEYTGGAHGNIGFKTFNFLLPNGQPLDIEQVIDGRKGLERLSALTVAELKQRLLADGGSDAKWIETGAGPEWSNFDAFILLSDTLLIQFAPYQVASYADGPQDVEIPLTALKGALRSNLGAWAQQLDVN